MGVDTKGFVVTRCKNVMLVSGLLERAFNKLIQDERKTVFPSTPFSQEAKDHYQSVDLTLSPSVDMVGCRFKFNGQDRTIQMFFTCDGDHENVAPNSLALMLGCWGESPLFMQYALHALSVFGPVYYDESDADAIDYAPLQDPRINVLQAIALGYIAHTALDAWVQSWDQGELANGVTDMSFEEFFGIEERKARALLTLHYEECWATVRELANQLKSQDLAPPCRALTEYQAQKAQEEEHSQASAQEQEHATAA